MRGRRTADTGLTLSPTAPAQPQWGGGLPGGEPSQGVPSPPQTGVTARVTPSSPGARAWPSPLPRAPGACPGQNLSPPRAPSPILGFLPSTPASALGPRRPTETSGRGGGSQRPPGVVVPSVAGARPDGSCSSARGTLGTVVSGTARPAAEARGAALHFPAGSAAGPRVRAWAPPASGGTGGSGAGPA